MTKVSNLEAFRLLGLATYAVTAACPRWGVEAAGNCLRVMPCGVFRIGWQTEKTAHLTLTRRWCQRLGMSVKSVSYQWLIQAHHASLIVFSGFRHPWLAGKPMNPNSTEEWEQENGNRGHSVVPILLSIRLLVTSRSSKLSMARGHFVIRASTFIRPSSF
jgi:hypothetical protein